MGTLISVLIYSKFIKTFKMSKNKSKLRARVLATDTKAISLNLKESTSKYFSSKTSVAETNISNNLPHKSMKRKHIIIEMEESPTDTNMSNALPSKKLIEKRLDKELSKPPVRWEKVYEAIREYRQNIVAPVDTMGCERLADEPSDNITPQVFLFIKINKINCIVDVYMLN